MKHSYRVECSCERCVREGKRREGQGRRERLVRPYRPSLRRLYPARQSRIAAEAWDAYESGRPMSSEDY